jgi:DeoR/GlpR family transcriptional regulator of sugar metabolism
MLPTQRRRAILAELRQAQAVSAEDLAQRFGVSTERPSSARAACTPGPG